MKINQEKIAKFMSQMTLQEKAGLCSGRDFWTTKPVERLGIPSVMMTDGPHGLRKQEGESDHLGMNDSIEAVCFPAGSAMASSFDRRLIHNIGKLLGEEARAEKVHTVLGPAINIKRSPLCGRNFEYLSEDPFLAGEMSASYVNGVQSEDVGVSVKHYAANNQEYHRMRVDTIVDERTLREIYLKAFEITVQKSKPWALMCAYNRLNGSYCCENAWLLTDMLRNEWDFDGIVMTDWGAMNNRVKALKSGLNLEMPGSNGINDKKIIEAVENGDLPIEVLDSAVTDLLYWILKGISEKPAIKYYDKLIHHEESLKAATQCAVLLKNDNNLLPLDRNKKVAFIGPYAKIPRFQGGGSSHIHPFKKTNALEAAHNMSVVCQYQSGTEADGETRNEKLLSDAIQAAKEAETAVLFVGLPDSYESEGYDRTHLNLPACQNELIEAIAAVQPHTVVVLHNGSPVEMPWVNQVPAILEMYLGGQAVGAATVDLLYGKANPCGKLAETFPLRIEDTPSYLQFPGDGKSVTYGEGVFVGYRWYDSRKMNVLFPFGHGLSYTKFKISDMRLSAEKLSNTESLTVTFLVKNIGACEGGEVVQLYVSPPQKQLAFRPAQELKGFEKVFLQPDEEKAITITLDKSAFSYYSTEYSKWIAPSGAYEIRVGNSSRNIACCKSVQVEFTMPKLIYNDIATIGDLMERGKMNVVGALMQNNPIFGKDAQDKSKEAAGGAISTQMQQAMLESIPLRLICGNRSNEEMQKMIDAE